MAFLGAEGLSSSTIDSYLAALRHCQLVTDPTCMAPSFHTPFMNLVLRGIKRVRAQGEHHPSRLPITVTVLRRIKTALARDPLSYRSVMVWAACCTGFFGFLRCSEFLVPDGTKFDPNIHLSVADVEFTQGPEQDIFLIHIKVAKTDQFRKGTTVALGSTKTDLCPVAALLDYLDKRGAGPGPLFLGADSIPLHRQAFVREVQKALCTVGIDGTLFNGHSFRIGAATSASAAGVAETTIKALGRWNSLAYQGYIRPSPQDLAQISKKLV